MGFSSIFKSSKKNGYELLGGSVENVFSDNESVNNSKRNGYELIGDSEEDAFSDDGPVHFVDESMSKLVDKALNDSCDPSGYVGCCFSPKDWCAAINHSLKSIAEELGISSDNDLDKLADEFSKQFTAKLSDKNIPKCVVVSCRKGLNMVLAQDKEARQGVSPSLSP